MSVRRALAGAVALLIGSAVLAAAPAGAQSERGGVVLQSTLAGLREVGPDGALGAGDLDGVGAATVTVEESRLCFSLNADGIELPAAAAHIHQGERGTNGPIVVTLAPPDGAGRAESCVADVEPGLLAELAGAPDGFYVNVHTAGFPGGAVRGQLQRADREGSLLGTRLTGAAEVGPEGQTGAGDPDGTGMSTVAVSTEARRVCVEIAAVGIELPAAAAHIHQGPAGENGPIVITLGAPDAVGLSRGCVRRLDQPLVDALVAEPSAFYVNVHTPGFPGGAVRGQLAPAEDLVPKPD